jgi:pyridoxal 5'-phosphate synthase pdxT subunit
LLKVGVLALQGSVKEHVNALKKLKVEPVLVKLPYDLKEINGLILPGGESTTMGKLMRQYGLDKEIKRRYKEGMPIYGSCAGAILLAKDIVGSKQPKLGLMDISIKRNEYGRQVDSFEAELDVFDMPFKGVFIRAPVISELHDGCKILSKFENKPVMVEQGNLLVSTFHPELTDDLRVHKYFIEMIDKSRTITF